MIQHLSATTPSSIDESAAAATASKGTGSHSAESTAQWLSGLDDSTYVDWLGPRGQWETGVIARFSDFRTELEIIQDDGGWMHTLLLLRHPSAASSRLQRLASSCYRYRYP